MECVLVEKTVDMTVCSLVDKMDNQLVWTLADVLVDLSGALKVGYWVVHLAVMLVLCLVAAMVLMWVG